MRFAMHDLLNADQLRYGKDWFVHQQTTWQKVVWSNQELVKTADANQLI
jgi:hypothetical protein